MRANRRRDTKPELRVRSALHREGLRFRVDYPILVLRDGQMRRVRVDIAFPARRIAVEVLGCFWHGCPDHRRSPFKHASYWREKVQANRLRDVANNRALEAEGWAVVPIWEHETREPADLDHALRFIRRLWEARG